MYRVQLQHKTRALRFRQFRNNKSDATIFQVFRFSKQTKKNYFFNRIKDHLLHEVIFTVNKCDNVNLCTENVLQSLRALSYIVTL